MSSGSAAFKAAAVAAVLAMLVLPSLGRCSSLGPAPPPPAPVTPPAPAPVPAPPVSCSACRASLVPACQSKCANACSSACDPPPGCDECRAMARHCTACCNNGTCSCDCKTNTDYDRRGHCRVSIVGCQFCQNNQMNRCMADCLSDCDATCAN